MAAINAHRDFDVEARALAERRKRLVDHSEDRVWNGKAWEVVL